MYMCTHISYILIKLTAFSLIWHNSMRKKYTIPFYVYILIDARSQCFMFSVFRSRVFSDSFSCFRYFVFGDNCSCFRFRCRNYSFLLRNSIVYVGGTTVNDVNLAGVSNDKLFLSLMVVLGGNWIFSVFKICVFFEMARNPNVLKSVIKP